MALQTATIFVSGFAALFAYLSWKKSVLTDIYRREEQLRARLSDPGMMFKTEHFSIRAFRVRVREHRSRWYRVRKYGLRGDVEGETQVTLEFDRGDGREIFKNEFERKDLESIGIYSLNSREISIEDESDDIITVTIIIDSIDPNTVEHNLVNYKVALDGYLEYRDDWEKLDDSE